MKAIPIESIKTNEAQPRRAHDESKIEELAGSIKAVGLLNPILVRPVGDLFEIVHGERRYRACKLAGIDAIRAEVRDLTDEQAFLIALTENIQREDLSPIDEAHALKHMIDELGYSQTKAGEALGKSQQYVADRLSLLRLPEQVKSMITARAVSPSVGRVLARHDDIEQVEELAQEVADGRLTVRGLRQVLSGSHPDRKNAIPPQDDDPVKTLEWCDRQFKSLKPRLDIAAAAVENDFAGYLPVDTENLSRDEWMDRFKEFAEFVNLTENLSREYAEVWIRRKRALFMLMKNLPPDNKTRLEYESSNSYFHAKRLARIPLEILQDFFNWAWESPERELTTTNAISYHRSYARAV